VTTLAISATTVVVIVALVVIDLFAIAFGLSFMRARKAQLGTPAAPGALPAPPATKGPKAVSRREFFRKSLLTSLAVFGAQFGGATLAMLWPNLKGGFGSVINAGNIDDIKSQIKDADYAYNGAGRFYVVGYNGKATADADYALTGVTLDGIMPLYQRCVHLGCRVPFCGSSKWFECPCHGSKYNGAGEYQLGPAPRGMDRFVVTIEANGTVFVDTSTVILGPPRGTDTINEPPQGPFCVAPG
jgi:cytochrome b6-f complex iron-sulfur subunit